MKESDMFLPIKEMLIENGCSDVYGEVLGTDVLGIDGPVNIIVEMKKNLSWKLLDQIMDRKRSALGQYLYIAIPERKGYLPHVVQNFLRKNKIGLIEVRKNNFEVVGGAYYAAVVKPARYQRVYKREIYRVRESIEDFHKTQKGGTPSGKETMTRYKATIEEVQYFLGRSKRGEWVKIDEILEHCETHYASPKPSLSKALREFEHEWCEMKKIKNRVHFRAIQNKLEGVRKY